jgi:hypothetical protein
MVPAACVQGKSKAARIVHGGFGLTGPAVLSNGFTGYENGISLRFRLALERDNEPVTGWMNGIVENLKLAGVLFRADLTEDTIDQLTERFTRVSLMMRLPGAGTVIVSDARLKYFRKESSRQDGTTVILGVALECLAEQEKADILKYLETGNRRWPSPDDNAPLPFP